MARTTIAIPIEGAQGVNSRISEHFGHCEAFLVSTIDGEKVIEANIIQNHGHTSCAEPVVHLAKLGVEVLLTKGMGGRPYMVTQQLGISVAKADGETAKDAIDAYINGQTRMFGDDSLCGGSGSCH